MDERSLVLLRRKLESLNYTDRLDAASAPLVSRLVEDLVKTTDSYRGIKLQASKYAQEISTFNTKVSGAAYRSSRGRAAPVAKCSGERALQRTPLLLIRAAVTGKASSAPAQHFSSPACSIQRYSISYGIKSNYSHQRSWTS